MADSKPQYHHHEPITALTYPQVDRVEVIGAGGREFVEYLSQSGAYVSIQDGGRTMKVFVGESREPE